MDCNTTSGVLKSNRRPVQATGQHDGEKLQVFVLLQHEASLEYLKNPFQVSYCMLFAYVPILYKFINFTIQNGERVVHVANDVGRSSRNSEVHELVVPRGQVYFESESLSKFMSNRVSSYIATCMHARTNNSTDCSRMYYHRRSIEAATKLVNARTIV